MAQPARDPRGLFASKDEEIDRLVTKADELEAEVRRLEQIIDNIVRVIDDKPIQ